MVVVITTGSRLAVEGFLRGRMGGVKGKESSSYRESGCVFGSNSTEKVPG